MKLQWDKWFYGLVQAIIGGAAAAGSAYVGTLIGNQLVTSIPVLRWQSLGFVLLTSSITNMFFFLKQSPLPSEVVEVVSTATLTTTTTKTPTEETPKEKS